MMKTGISSFRIAVQMRFEMLFSHFTRLEYKWSFIVIDDVDDNDMTPMHTCIGLNDFVIESMGHTGNLFI